MNRATRIYILLVFAIVFLAANAGFSPRINNPKVEYVVGVFDLSTKDQVKAHLFYAFSSNIQSEAPTRFTFWDLPPEYILESKVTDLLFFEAKYVKPVEKTLLDNESIELSNKRQNERIETAAIALFEQPFWSMHLAFRLPTLFLEWQLKQKERFAGHDPWPRAVSSTDLNLSTDSFLEKVPLENKSGFNLTYQIPQSSDKLTTHGIMFEYIENLRSGGDPIDVVEKILNTKIKFSGTGQDLQIPIYKLYIKSPKEKGGVFFGAIDTDEIDYESLINRVNSRENGSFSNMYGITVGNDIIQRLVVYVNPNREKNPVMARITELSTQAMFPRPALPMGRFESFIKLISTLLVGLVVWIIAFMVFHMNILKDQRMLSRLWLALRSYLLYALVSIVFSFMYGFGFVLGIVAMESANSRLPIKQPIYKLLAWGLCTSLVTALVVYLIHI